ncbi:MAG TPA: hypothetical protein PL033_14510 [Candidatus Brocadiia bacterium]|nr:hypothetical protein [Candidatus Brocadiia bacterium]
MITSHIMISNRCLYMLMALLILTATASPTAAADGEGAARIVSPSRLVAGSRERVVVELTIGPSGVAVGGGVSLGFHHAASWQGLQTGDPKRDGYMTVACDAPDNLDVKWHGWHPKGMFPPDKPSGSSDSIHHQCLVAKVRRVPLKPGERVIFTLGAGEARTIVQPFADPNHEFHLTTDADGDGVFRGIAAQPTMPIHPAEAHHLAASCPATVITGTEFRLLIRAEDRFYNLATDYASTVNISDEDGSVVAQGVKLSDGIAAIAVKVASPGPKRFRLSDGKLSGRSNPCRALDFTPRYRVFWGDIHGHTTISDGLGDTAEGYFAFGRDVAGLDVCALTDHGHFDWPQTVAAVKKFHEPGRFVTILAQEAGAGEDHMNLYFRRDDAPHIGTWASRYNQFNEIVFNQYNKDGREVITGPHHFTYPRGDARYPFGAFDDRTARFVEVYSSHGTSEYPGNPRPLPGAKDADKFMQSGLAKGLRFGVIGSSDNHDSHPGRTIWGRYPGGHIAFIAEELTREAIWDALWHRRVYAASFDRIYMEFTINSQPMGSEIEVSNPCFIRYRVIGQTDVLTARLIRDNEEIRADRTDTGVIEIETDDDPPLGRDSFYYLRVEQDNGERAWSTPIWVLRD